MKHIDELTREVLGVAVRLHRDLGPVLLESVYEMVLAGRLTSLGHLVERQKPIDIDFEGLQFVGAFKIDLLVDKRLILEIKSVEKVHAAHAKQLLTYLRLTKLSVGLVINFGGATLMYGVRRMVNNHTDSAPSASLREHG